jgi:hypothetical protein
MKAKRTDGATVIAETFGCDVREMKEYRYQSTRTKQAIYAIGAKYFTVSSDQPKDKDFAWQLNKDQWSAQRHGTQLWVAETESQDEWDQHQKEAITRKYLACT